MSSRGDDSNRADDVELASARTEVAPLDRAPPPSLGRSSLVEEGPALFANRYEILGMLGGGAMGMVYRARDRELDEIVALKMLRHELASTPGMLERFRREVKLARRVTHRNVARTFDIGEHGGDRFLTMEFIAGEMLGAYLARRGRLPVAEVVTIGRDVCAGLAAAHAADVLHRDLKPENVVLATDNRAVITDFGIARAAAQAEVGRTVGIVGTPAYMAPEQVEGASDIDARVDLYALGVMLFELLTGAMAWTGDTAIAIAAARLLRPPPDPRTILPSLPTGIADIVVRLMARRREDRFSSADETDRALASLTSEGRPSERSLPPSIGGERVRPSYTPPSAGKTVAVLPLSNLGAADDAYLADMLTEDLVDLLSVTPELRVRPRGETSRFDAQPRDAREIGRALSVDVVVDGSVRRVADVLRISVRLVSVEDGFQLWARRFDRAPAKVLSVADEAATAIAQALATSHKARAHATVVDPVAQDLYLRGRHLLHRSWFETVRPAADMLREAWERAPTDARIGGTYALAIARTVAGEANSGDRANEARRVIEKVLEADRMQPEAHVALGMLHANAGEGAAAAMTLGRALSAAPNQTDALDALGRILIEVGRVEQGLGFLQKAIAIDPEMSQARYAIARVHVLLGDMESYEAVLGSVPTHHGDLAAYMLARARMALWLGDAEAARRLNGELATMPLTPYGRMAVEGFLRVGMTRTLSPEDAAALERIAGSDGRFPPRRLAFHAQIRVEMRTSGGNIAGAIADLHDADGHGLIDIEWLDRCPLLAPLRSSAEFATVRKNVERRAARIIEVVDGTSS